MIANWRSLPERMKTEKVKEYYGVLKSKTGALLVKRIFDIVFSLILIVILAIPRLVIGIMIKLDSKGPVFYRQERVTKNGQVFRIFKFRTMVQDADKIGTHVTVGEDPRITAMGHKLRNSRLDEFPQLFNVIKGEMSFVGTRPEAIKYVEAYSDEMMATLLLPAGITSRASIAYKDEAELLEKADDPDKVYVEKILPEKMKYNLDYIRNFSLGEDLKILMDTVKAVL